MSVSDDVTGVYTCLCCNSAGLTPKLFIHFTLGKITFKSDSAATFNIKHPQFAHLHPYL